MLANMFDSHYFSSPGKFIQLFHNISFCVAANLMQDSVLLPTWNERAQRLRTSRDHSHPDQIIHRSFYIKSQFWTCILVSGFSNFRVGQKGRAVNKGEFIYAMFDNKGELKQVRTFKIWSKNMFINQNRIRDRFSATNLQDEVMIVIMKGKFSRIYHSNVFHLNKIS